jgi:hypothetical protein
MSCPLASLFGHGDAVRGPILHRFLEILWRWATMLEPIVREHALLSLRDVRSGDEADAGDAGLFADDEYRQRLKITEQTVRLDRLEALPKSHPRHTDQSREHVVGQYLSIPSRECQHGPNLNRTLTRCHR